MGYVVNVPCKDPRVRTDPSFGHDIFGQTGDLKVFFFEKMNS